MLDNRIGTREDDYRPTLTPGLREHENRLCHGPLRSFAPPGVTWPVQDRRSTDPARPAHLPLPERAQRHAEEPEDLDHTVAPQLVHVPAHERRLREHAPRLLNEHS